ncbi:type IV pilus modification PilV family protein [Planococcus lenghuensis]|uniref:Prepilin-type N-terminal cleavage/methylation domain-containing protein n=1 Tax=Planococcus lenghuensis TaxID=2213202 RepID=A0A1Q2KXQ0_9BACL|nr:type II secretion system protein [Planococcus lenghuensis]AQQ52884.1 hypothetical protein B0X71_07135 [Planococcus lenghuensis]
MKKVLIAKQDGLTLIEVLAALVILGILFVGIMSVFPQMTLFNVKTEAKLSTMNLARQEMADVTERTKWEKQLLDLPAEPTAEDMLAAAPSYLTDTKISSEMSAAGYSWISKTADYIRYQKNGDYRYEVDVYLKCEPFLNPESVNPDAAAPDAGTCSVADKQKLYKVHLKVLQESTPGSGNYRLSSETFSYLAYTAVPAAPVASAGGG